MIRIAFLQSGSGAITLMIGNETHNIAVDHPNYFNIITALENPDAEELKSLLDVPTAINDYTDDKVKIKEGLFMYDGHELHNTLTERIMKLMIAGHPFKYMVNFLNNLMENPSGRAVKELYPFLENRSLPITDDGCFLCYKSVREDWTDVWSGTINNEVGQKVSIPRNQVDDNCDMGCSYGLHAGAIEYVSEYHAGDGHTVIVKINPKDVVSVPLDCDCTKVRVCSYEVVDTYELELKKPVYTTMVGSIEELVGMFDKNLATHWYEDDDDDYEDNEDNE